MVVRARYVLAAASSALVLVRILVACSISGKSETAPEAGPPGEAFTACEIQGYVSETEAGLCPEGTCPALAFDTNGARVPCCTSIVSGPAMCFDGAEPGLPDGAEPEAAAEGGDAAGGTESGADAAAEAGPDGAVEADAETGASEGGPSPDAADAE